MATFNPLSLSSPSSFETPLDPSLTLTSQQPTPTKGYPTHILGLTQNEIDANFLCGYCNALLRDPQQASCGHRFCEICLTRLIKSHKGTVLCPQCMQEGINDDNATIKLDQIPDKAIKRLMGKQKIVCPNAGCAWKGVLLNYDSHEVVCPYATLTCPNEGCKVESQRSRFKAHLEQCMQRNVTCKSCSSMILFDSFVEHLHHCPSAEVEAGVETQVDSEMEYVGDTRPVPSHLITGTQMLRRETKRGEAISGISNARLKSEIEEIAKRLRVLENKSKSIKTDLAPYPSTFATRSSANIPPFSPQSSPGLSDSTIETARRKLELCYQNAKTFEGMVMALNNSFDRLLSQVTEIDTQRRKENEERETQARKIEQLENALAHQSRQIEMMESTSYNGVYVWKISNFAMKRQDAINGTQKSIDSPCFYTSKFGYKMCARMYSTFDKKASKLAD